MNDRVGISYLKNNTKTPLHGAKSVSKIVTGLPMMSAKQVVYGSKGDNLVMTMIIRFREEIRRDSFESLLKKLKPWF